MKCVVTGIETKHKFKGEPVCREIMDLVKNLKAKNPQMSNAQALAQVHTTFLEVKRNNERNESFDKE